MTPNPLDDAARDTLSQWLFTVAESSSQDDFERLLALGADPCWVPDSWKGQGAARRAALPRLAKQGDFRKIQAIFERAQPSPSSLGAAMLEAFDDASLDARAQLEIFEILARHAGPEAPQAAALALEASLRSPRARRSTHLLLLHGLVDFAQNAPGGAPWVFALAKASLEPRSEPLARQAFESSWGAQSAPSALAQPGHNGRGLQHLAAQSGFMPALEALAPHVDWGVPDGEGARPLSIAAAFGRAQAFDFLLARADPCKNRLGRDGATEALLSLAEPQEGWDPQKASLALAAVADPLAIDALGRSAADWARELGFSEAADLLKRRAGRNPAAQPAFGAQAQDDALLDEISRLLRSRRAVAQAPLPVAALARGLSRIDARHSVHGRTALRLTCRAETIDHARDLLALGANPNLLDPEGDSPVASACSWSSWADPKTLELVRLLATPQACAHGADPRGGALRLALVGKAPVEAIELLAPLSDLPAHGRRALKAAARVSGEHFKALWRFALEGGSLAEWAKPLQGECWPEALAAQGALEELLRAQRDGAFGPQGMAGRRVQGQSLLSWAAARATPIAIKRMLPFFDVRQTDPLGRDALAFALEARRDACARILAQFADPLATDDAGFSPLEKARLFNCLDALPAIDERARAAREAIELEQALPAAPSKKIRRF